jgi:hypothetical protein
MLERRRAESDEARAYRTFPSERALTGVISPRRQRQDIACSTLGLCEEAEAAETANTLWEVQNMVNPIPTLALEGAKLLAPKLIEEASGRIRRKFAGDKARQAALRDALEQALSACLKTMAPPDVWKQERYEGVFHHFITLEVVVEEFSKLVDLRPDTELDVARLEQSFRNAGYNPAHFPGVDFPAAMQALARAFLNEASRSETLQPVIEIQLLRKVVAKLELMAPTIRTTAEHAKLIPKIAEDTSAIRAYLEGSAGADRVIDSANALASRPQYPGKQKILTQASREIISYIMIGNDPKQVSFTTDVQLLTGHTAKDVLAGLEKEKVKDFYFDDLDQFNDVFSTIKRLGQRSRGHLKTFAEMWSDEVIKRAKQATLQKKRHPIRHELGQGIKYVRVGFRQEWAPWIEAFMKFDPSYTSAPMESDVEEVWFESVEEAQEVLATFQRIIKQAGGNERLYKRLIADESLAKVQKRFLDRFPEGKQP